MKNCTTIVFLALALRAAAVTLPDLAPGEMEYYGYVEPATVEDPPDLIMGRGVMSPGQLVSFFLENNSDADEVRVARLAALYIEESAVEGVNADVAFVQMCLETGFLRFGGLVSPEQNNFCGLGATGPGEPGLFFPDERTGVRAHIQHLKGYGSTEPLVGEQVDPRYTYISPKGKSPGIAGLAGTWAADPLYAVKLSDLLESLYR